MIDTVDLTSYIPGYEQYCMDNDMARLERLDEETEKNEKIISGLRNLINDIEFTLDEKATDDKKLQIIRALINDSRNLL